MVMGATQRVTGVYWILIVVLIGMMSPLSSWAENIFTPAEIKRFRGNENQCNAARRLAARLMDDEALFLEAESRRDAKMTNAQRLINFQWLMQDESRRYQGGAALGKLFRLGFHHYWNQRSEPLKVGQGSVVHVENKPSPVRDIRNYRLNVTQSRVHLGFRYRF